MAKGIFANTMPIVFSISHLSVFPSKPNNKPTRDMVLIITADIMKIAPV